MMLPTSCTWCPRACGANRAAGEKGYCGADDTLRIARAALHFWEEPPLSGQRGSGAIFFSCCAVRCVYCQNARIANGQVGRAISIERLAEICLELEGEGALNLNMVTPTHYAYHIASAVGLAHERGCTLPVVFNTSGYETVQTVRDMRETADIWLTDFKYASADVAQAYSHAADYPQVALAALDVMVEQAGRPVFDTVDGQPRMRSGVLVRHLLLPGQVEESCQVIRLLYERYGDEVQYSLMNQYTPIIAPGSATARRFPELLGRVSDDEYNLVLDFADNLGLTEYYWQDGPTAEESFIPAFDYEGVDHAAGGAKDQPGADETGSRGAGKPVS